MQSGNRDGGNGHDDSHNVRVLTQQAKRVSMHKGAAGQADGRHRDRTDSRHDNHDGDRRSEHSGSEVRLRRHRKRFALHTIRDNSRKQTRQNKETLIYRGKHNSIRLEGREGVRGGRPVRGGDPIWKRVRTKRLHHRQGEKRNTCVHAREHRPLRHEMPKALGGEHTTDIQRNGDYAKRQRPGDVRRVR